jgi:hypothetical protein
MEMNFNQLETILEEAVEKILEFINSNKKYTDDITKLYRDYAVGGNINFNIFTSLSDQYYKENLHSDVLKLIFDPYTGKIGNVKYIKIFKNFIEKTLNKKINLNLKKIKIKREYHRIDLFIYDEAKNCIFIENKINNAPDRENQIGKYYKTLKDEKYTINAVIYLTLSPLKKLNREYSIEDPGLRKEIEEILLEIPVINKINEDSFVNNVISRCAEEARKSNNAVPVAYLTEYEELLKHLGGNFMALDLNTQAMYRIFEDKSTLNSFRILGSLWDSRQNLIGNIFGEYFQHELKFLVYPEDDETFYKCIKTGVTIGLHPSDFSFGFVHTPGNPEWGYPENIFKGLLEDERLKKYFTDDEVYVDEWWICKFIDYNNISCLRDLKELEETLENIINESNL